MLSPNATPFVTRVTAAKNRARLLLPKIVHDLLMVQDT